MTPVFGAGTDTASPVEPGRTNGNGPAVDTFDDRAPIGLALQFGPSYRNDRSRSLSSPPRDVEQMAKVARVRGFETRCFVDEKATSVVFFAELDQAAARLRAGDTLLLQFSGHGVQVEDGNGDEEDHKDEAIVLSDRLVVDDELKEKLLKFRAGVNIVVLVDACHSGTIIDADGPGEPVARVISFSATPDAAVTPTGRLSSAFTDALLRNLNTKPPRWDPTRPASPPTYRALFRLVRWDDREQWDSAPVAPLFDSTGPHGFGSTWDPVRLLDGKVYEAGPPQLHLSGPDAELLAEQAPFTI